VLPPNSSGRPLRFQISSSSSSSAGGEGENVGCSDTLTDLRRLVPAPVPVAELEDALTSESFCPGMASEDEDAGKVAGGGVGVASSSSDSRTVRNDRTDPLSLPSSSSLSFPLGVAVSDSTMTRGGAKGITMGFGGGAGGDGDTGEWFRSALRNGTFGTKPGDVAGIGTRGGGGSDDGRCRVDEPDTGCGMASTLPGARTDSYAIPWPPSPWRLYFATDGGARTLNKPLTLLVLPTGSGGKPALARSQASRLPRVTPSTIVMSDSWLDPARPTSTCGGEALGYVTDALFPWPSEALRPTPELGVASAEGKLTVRSSVLLRRRKVGVALPVLREELCRDTSTLERESASTRRSVFGFGAGFARVGVDDPGVDVADKPTEATDDEREWAGVEAERCEGRDGVPSKTERFLVDPLRAPRPLTAAPSLIHP